MTNEQEIVWSVFGVYLNDLKAYSTKPDRPTFKRLEEVRDRAIKALEQQRWIPVSERLPKEYGEYICTMSNGDIQECGFVPNGEKELILGWSTCEADGFKKLDYQDVTAWMPLPQPYKAESEVTMQLNTPTHEGYTERCNHTQSEGAYDE